MKKIKIEINLSYYTFVCVCVCVCGGGGGGGRMCVYINGTFIILVYLRIIRNDVDMTGVSLGLIFVPLSLTFGMHKKNKEKRKKNFLSCVIAFQQAPDIFARGVSHAETIIRVIIKYLAHKK